MTAVYKRELSAYFSSMIGYVFIAVVSAFVGLYFYLINVVGGYPYFSTTLNNAVSVFLFSIPILTMRSLSEERKTKTDQMLLTYPVSVTGVVLGKFLAMATVFLVPMVVCCYCPLVIAANGTGYMLADYASILAFYLLGCLYLAVGMFISSLTENQIIACVCTFAALFAFQMWGSIVDVLPTSAPGNLAGLLAVLALAVYLIYAMSRSRLLVLAVAVAGAAVLGVWYAVDSAAFAGVLPRVLGSFSVVATFSNFAAYDVFDLGGIVLFLSMTALFLFLTVQSVRRRRWS